MTKKKGYGNVSPRFQKYFARHKSSSGPHDPKNAKQAAKELTEIDDMFTEMNAYEEQELKELARRWGKSADVFDVGEVVRVSRDESPDVGEDGRIVVRRMDKGDITYGVVFDYDPDQTVEYFTGFDYDPDQTVEYFTGRQLSRAQED